MEDTNLTQWRKASYSNGGGNACVEVGMSADRVTVRDTTDREGTVLKVSTPAWTEFLTRLR